MFDVNRNILEPPMIFPVRRKTINKTSRIKTGIIIGESLY
jgi:hypothetical protein